MTGTAVAQWNENPRPIGLAEEASFFTVDAGRVAAEAATAISPSSFAIFVDVLAVLLGSPTARYKFDSNLKGWSSHFHQHSRQPQLDAFLDLDMGAAREVQRRHLVTYRKAWLATIVDGRRPALNAERAHWVATDHLDLAELIAAPIVNADFVVSRGLVDSWRNGVEFFSKLAGHKNAKDLLNTITALDVYSLRRQMGAQVMEAIVGEGRFLRARSNAVCTVVHTDGKLDSVFELLLSEQFQIRPLELSDFLKSLTGELMDFFQNGNEISGEWGKLYSKHGSLAFHFSPFSRNEKKRPAVPRVNIELLK